MRFPPILAVLALALLAFFAPASQAFGSVQKGGSPHDDITAVAAQLGWPEDAVQALQAGVRQPDIDGLQPAPIEGDKDRMDVSPTFRAWHHCDRIPPGSDGEAFAATVAYIAHERDLADNLTLLDPAAAMRALGRALHALQDCYSHSNIVDLGPEAQTRLHDALLKGGKAPAGLQLVSSLPGAVDIGRPPGDLNPHADYNKDGPDSTPESALLMPDGRTKHEFARDLASNATAAFLQSFMAGLDATETERLLGVEPLHEGIGEGGSLLSIPAPALLALIAVPLAATVLRRRS